MCLEKANHLFPNRPAAKTLAAFCVLGALWAGAAFAEEQKSSDDRQTYLRSAGNSPSASQPIGELVQEGPNGGIWQRDQLLGDMGGLRSYLGNYGISFKLQETSEIFGNTSGGVKKGADYDGLTTATLQMDTQRAFGWRGGTVNISGLNVHGTNFSAQNLDNLQTASGIEADRGLRLWEAWYDQAFLNNRADVKIGQQSLDQEFMNSQYAGLFANSMFGWPMLPSADLPSGGPSYPLSSLGVRVLAQLLGPWSFLGGIFDDNPSGISPYGGADSQQLNRTGTNFRLGDNPLAIMEIQYTHPALGDLEYNGKASALPGTYKLGFWYDGGRFADQAYDNAGLSLANPASSSIPGLHRGDYSIYGVIDQMLWRENPQSEESIGFFMRAMGAPENRNLVDFSLNAGFTYREPFEYREDDVFGIGLGYTHVSGTASGFDRQIAFYSANGAFPVRSGETFVEVTYQYQIAPWWSLQPDFQYVFNPGAGAVNPNDATSTERLGNETIFGLLTNITF